jgi:hypothetical protein
MTNGTVLCVDQSFLDYAGWWVPALPGQPYLRRLAAWDRAFCFEAHNR